MKKLAIGMPGFAGLLFLAVLLLSAGACSNQDPQQLIQEANQLLQNRDLIGAEAKFAQYLEQQPHGPSAPMAVWGLAQCSLGQEEYARAREQLQRFIDMIGGPSNQQGFRGLALLHETYVREGKPKVALEEALKSSDTLTQLPKPAIFAYNLRLADLYQRADQPEEAKNILITLLDRGPFTRDRHIPVLERIAQHFRDMNRLEAALDIYQQYLQEHPDLSFKGELLMRIATLQEDLGREDAARQTRQQTAAYFQRKVDEAIGSEEQTRMMLNLSQIQNALGEFEKAEHTLQTVIDEHPLSLSRPIAMVFLSELYLRKGQKQNAQDLLAQLVEEHPRHRLAQFARQQVQQLAATAPTTGSAQTVPGGPPPMPEAPAPAGEDALLETGTPTSPPPGAPRP